MDRVKLAPDKRHKTKKEKTKHMPSKSKKQKNERGLGTFCATCQRITPVFADMIEDRTRDRIMLVAGMTFLFFLIILSANPLQPGKPTVEKMSFGSPPQLSQSLGIAAGRAPRIFTQLSDGKIPPLKFIQGIVSVDSIVVPDAKETIDCSTSRLRALQDTIESLRFAEPCKVKIEHDTTDSDSAGVLNFEQLTIDGPAGDYHLKFSAKDTKVSLTKTISMVNVVSIF